MQNRALEEGLLPKLSRSARFALGTWIQNIVIYKRNGWAILSKFSEGGEVVAHMRTGKTSRFLNIDHLGLVAEIIDDLGLVEQINEFSRFAHFLMS